MGKPLSYPEDSHRRRSKTKGVLIIFAKFTEKHLSQSLIFNKVAGLSPALDERRDTDIGVFL